MNNTVEIQNKLAATLSQFANIPEGETAKLFGQGKVKRFLSMLFLFVMVQYPKHSVLSIAGFSGTFIPTGKAGSIQNHLCRNRAF